jgi:hypothetical protein
VYAGMDENRMSMSLCATVRVSGDGATITCDTMIVGKHVMVVNRNGPVVLCDFHVKGTRIFIKISIFMAIKLSLLMFDLNY